MASEPNNENVLIKSSDDDHRFINLDLPTSNKLANGILETFEKDRESSRLLLASVLQTQSVLLETIQQENLKFNENLTINEVWKTMDRAKIYHSKLLAIRQEMSGLAEKTKALKVKSLQLSQLQMKHHLDQESRRAAELELDKKIIAKVNIPHSNSDN